MGNCSGASLISDPSIRETTVSCKIAIVGSPGSGKSSILRRFTKNAFTPTYEPTREAEIAVVVRKVNVPGYLIVSLSFWDTPGRDNVDLRRTYFEDLDAAIVVVDLSDRSDMALAGTWRQLVVNAASRSMVQPPADDSAAPNEIPMILLANKYDLVGPDERDGEGKQKGPPVPGQEHLNEEGTSLRDDGQESLSSGKDGDDVQESLSSVGKDGPRPELTPEEADGSQTGSSLERQLQQAVKANGFVEGFFVSAKDPDGGVHQAVQFLLRRLAQLRLPLLEQRTKASEKPGEAFESKKQVQSSDSETQGQ